MIGKDSDLTSIHSLCLFVIDVRKKEVRTEDSIESSVETPTSETCTATQLEEARMAVIRDLL